MFKRLKTMVVATASTMMLSTAASAQLPTPSHGWNLGNTLEPNCGVGCWGPQPTQALINSVAAAGFNTVRIPCAWASNANRSGTINASYMTQVTQVVNWCTAKGLYVIINDHWDGGWFENSNFGTYNKTINSKLQNIWTQVANNFKNYDSHVLFACANEPNASTAAQTTTLFKYYQTFVNTVRATGGGNSSRWLILQGPGANIDNTYNYVTALPSDPTPGRLMMEVHDYDPYQFTLMTSDQSWGPMFYFWGSAYHITGLANRNATWGEEAWVSSEFAKMKSKFIDHGIPVLLGEWRAEPKPAEPDLTGQYVTQNYNSCTYWNYYYHNTANSYGLYVTCWDTPQQIFDWTTGAILDQTQINSLLGKSYVPPVSGL